jgi:hypothetical protein
MLKHCILDTTAMFQMCCLKSYFFFHMRSHLCASVSHMKIEIRPQPTHEAQQFPKYNSFNT